MQSDHAADNIQTIINNLHSYSVHASYKSICDLILSELLPSNNLKPKKCSHPWWNSTLNQLKLDLRQCQKTWLKQKNNSQLKLSYQTLQKSFDKAVKKAKSTYRKSQQIQLLHQCKYDSKNFWRNFKQIGINSEKKGIPMQVISSDGATISEPDLYLCVWKDYFKSLYNQASIPKDGSLPTLAYTSPNTSDCLELNSTISFDEVDLAVAGINPNKAPGLDKIQGSHLKHPNLIPLLFSLFTLCFDSAVVPTAWCSALIHPILKPNTPDPRNPANYRGIALQSTVLKAFCKILNNRVTSWLESNNILSDEQNGFRPDRSCLDHLFVLTSIINNRKLIKLPTFVAFIDLKKAFDSVDRNLLWYSLEHYGINGKFLEILKSLYSNTEYRVRVNGCVSEPFPVSSGVKQGCLLSPTLFNLFINSLIAEIKKLGLGVKCGELLLAILAFADDIALIAESEQELQAMLGALYSWCNTWLLQINPTKSKVVHFRPKSQNRSSFKFMCGPSSLETVPSYKYLGIWLNEHLDYQSCIKPLADSGRKALGLLIAKSKQFGNFPFEAFSSLYESLVVPRLDYAAGIWGYKPFPILQTIQNKAIRHALGVGKNCPVAVLEGDSGWIPVWYRHQLEVLKLWYRLSNMDDSRLTKKIFNWSLTLADKGKATWCSQVKKLLDQISLGHLNPNNVTNLSPTEFQSIITSKLIDKANQEWKVRIWDPRSYNLDSGGRLLNYRILKKLPCTEQYLSNIHCKGHRWIIAALRGGCLPLQVETGRYRLPKTPYHLRSCKLCGSGEVETEHHFVMLCKALDQERSVLFQCLSSVDPSFSRLCSVDKFTYILCTGSYSSLIGKHLFNMYKIRLQLLTL